MRYGKFLAGLLLGAALLVAMNTGQAYDPDDEIVTIVKGEEKADTALKTETGSEIEYNKSAPQYQRPSDNSRADDWFERPEDASKTDEKGKRTGDALVTYDLSETGGKAPLPLHYDLAKSAFVEVFDNEAASGEPAGSASPRSPRPGAPCPRRSSPA